MGSTLRYSPKGGFLNNFYISSSSSSWVSTPIRPLRWFNSPFFGSTPLLLNNYLTQYFSSFASLDSTPFLMSPRFPSCFRYFWIRLHLFHFLAIHHGFNPLFPLIALTDTMKCTCLNMNYWVVCQGPWLKSRIKVDIWMIWSTIGSTRNESDIKESDIETSLGQSKVRVWYWYEMA